MLVVTGIVVVAADDAAVARGLMATVATATRQEAGCRTYAFYEDVETPGRFRVYEEWDGDDALKAHFEAPHMATFRAGLGEITVVSRDIVKFQGGEKTPI